MTMTAISNPANAVTPNVIPAAALAPMASRELCFGSIPIIAGPSRLDSAASSATELDAKEIREIVY